jgi:hypothetical protein
MLLKLWRAVRSNLTRWWRRCRMYALRILESLTASEFLTYEDPDWEGLVKHAAPKGEGLVLADYYLLKTIWEVFKTDR